jgi:uncharacterized membrane protein YbhN (UPF0104 family)
MSLNRVFAVTRTPLAKKLLKAAVALAILVSLARAFNGYRIALAGRLEHTQFVWLGVGLVLSVFYRVVNACGWGLVLRALGQPMKTTTGVRIWLVSETLRWLPGSVWSFFSRVSRAQAAGVPAVAASLSLPLELLLTIGAWGVAALVGIGLSGTGAEWVSRVSAAGVGAGVLGAALTVGAAFALARWRPSAKFSRKLRGLHESLRQLSEARLSLPLLLGIFVFFLVLCFFNGAAFLAVLRAVYASPPSFLAAVGINGAGWLVGFFAFFAPAGLGVREGSMTAMLAPLMPVDAAVVAVLLWRLVQLAAEVLCLGACLLPTVASAVRRRAANTWALTR